MSSDEESAAGATPPFFTDRHDPMLAEYHDLIDEFRERSVRELHLRVPAKLVLEGEVQMMQFVLLAAQHHPDVLEKLFCGVVFEFEDPEPTLPGDTLEELEWKRDPTVQRWLARMQELVPVATYFSQDRDARFFMLFGDILNRERDQLTFEPVHGGREQRVGMTGEQAQQFFSRLIQAAVMLVHFCRPAEVDPQVAIEAVFADFDVEEQTGWNFEKVMEQVHDDLARGFQIRASHISHEELDEIAPWDGPSEPPADDDE